jgi:hypothetical protein
MRLLTCRCPVLARRQGLPTKGFDVRERHSQRDESSEMLENRSRFGLGTFDDRAVRNHCVP